MKDHNDDKFWELLASKIHGELSPEEAVELETILSRDENAGILIKLTGIKEKLQQTKQLKDFFTEKSWKKIASRIRHKKIRTILTVTKYAAIVVLTLGLGSLLHTGKTNKKEIIKTSEIFVPLGQMSQTTLFDGSEVWLNSGTTLQYSNDYGIEKREVILNGEAFFRVKPSDPPFRVKLKNSEIEVQGTSFNVVSFQNENFSEITLVEGIVKINTPEGKEIIRLHPSEQIRLSDDLKDNSLKKVDSGFYVSWTKGKIVFEEERLADVTEKLKRWYNVEIIFTEKEIGNYRFSGTILKNKPFDQIVKAFALLLPVKIEYNNNMNSKDTVLISKKFIPMRK